MHREQPDWLTRYPIAHRGRYSIDQSIPENSMMAFKRAIEKACAISLDIQIISDLEIIVFHDDNLKRMCGLARPVRELECSELGRSILLGRDQIRTDQTIPLLSEVLRVVDGRVPVYISVPRPTVRRALFIILNALADYRGPLAIYSSDPFILKWFRSHGPFLIRGQFISRSLHVELPPFKRLLLRVIRPGMIGKPHFLICDARDMPGRSLKGRRMKGVPLLSFIN